MRYPKVPDYEGLAKELRLCSQVQVERGAKGVAAVLAEAERGMKSSLSKLKRLAADEGLSRREPNDLAGIRALRPSGPRRLGDRVDPKTLPKQLAGALLGRMAGCTLGAPVEAYSIEDMAALARANGQAFPPVEYWRSVPDPHRKRYGRSCREDYTPAKMDGVPVDDDIVYTLLGLLVMEEYGPDFTLEQLADAWKKHVPYACTAEAVALANLRRGVPAARAATVGNPFHQWIGAAIRADPWGYMAPGRPELAAEWAWRDARLSARRNGIYGEMFFAAAISAAFTVRHPLEAIEIGLTEVPRRCALATAVRFALKLAPRMRDYSQARAAVDERFAGMHHVHTINNACLTVWGLAIGGTDFTKVIGQTVAMGLDNDCTAATAGSICGAIVGRKGIPKHWTRGFGNKVHSYLRRRPVFRIDDLLARFARQQRRVQREIP